MRDLLDRLRTAILFALIVMVALATMVSDRRASRGSERERTLVAGMVLDVASPLQKMMATPADLAREVWTQYVALLALRSENDRLRERIAVLQEENLQYREALVASGRLQRIADMRSDFETPMLPSEVVGQDVSAWYRSVLLDRGRSRGIQPGMPVVTDQGVVGLVTATSSRASQAMLLTDRQSSVDGLVQRSRAQGIVRGRRGDLLEFEFAVRGADVREGGRRHHLGPRRGLPQGPAGGRGGGGARGGRPAPDRSGASRGGLRPAGGRLRHALAGAHHGPPLSRRGNAPVRRAVGLFALGFVALLAQGTLATLMPVWAFPDVVFLVVVGMAVAVGGVESLLVAALLGYSLDLLSNALLGQHALLLVLASAATRIANLQLNLMRTLPRVAFVAGLTVCLDLGHAGLARLFGAGVGVDSEFLRQVAVHAAINATVAPFVVALVQRVSGVLAGEEEPQRRTLRVQPRERVGWE